MCLVFEIEKAKKWWCFAGSFWGQFFLTYLLEPLFLTSQRYCYLVARALISLIVGLVIGGAELTCSKVTIGFSGCHL